MLSESNFRFTLLEDAKFPGLESKQVKELFYKWGFTDHLYVKRFIYDQYLQEYDIDKFLLHLFNNNPHIKVLSKSDQWGTLGKVTLVEKEETAHSVTNLQFFDRLRIVRENGDIVKSLDEYYEGFLVADELRKCLLMPEFETFDYFSKEDRKEFIFHVFKALCLGGRLCQYEDSIQDYLLATKLVYKDLITVTRDPATKQLRVASLVFKINHVESTVSPLFPSEHPQNFCYVSIDPLKRHCNVFYHSSDQYY
ncbi:hypothetical protein EDD86DRAFT_195377 [Gorgonomyces haynaldii]|nr:hypothetical protein EDD86DRAFT_195377 [Gorgonomyces haynaldii]